ncbi:MAG: response regulator [Rhodospirillaceae bacterium]|nr:response regulator [Rhodospirillaceae bacterium]MCA8932721.1 response regulator [Rhodospirillaceae bacterium]
MTREATVLIAEDSPTQAAQITFLLTEHGYNVVRARNGREALDLLRQNLPDILISDVVMPEMNGYDLCRAVKSDPVTARLPVILVTGLSSPQDVFKGLNAGADNFVTKPYDESNLVSRIDYLLANQKIRAGENLRSGIEIELNGQRHFITAERQQILDLLISTYEQAIHLYDTLEERQRDLSKSYHLLDALYGFADDLNRCRTRAEVASAAIERAAKLPQVVAGWIYLNDGGTYAMASAIGVPYGVVPEMLDPSSIDHPKPETAAYRPQPCELEMSATMADQWGPQDHKWVSIDLTNDGEILGVLGLIYQVDHAISDENVKTLTSVGYQIGVALERARLHESLERKVEERTSELQRSERALAIHARQQATVATFGIRALGESSTGGICQSAMNALTQTFDAPFVRISEFRPATGGWVTHAASGWPEDVTVAADPEIADLVGAVMASSEPLAVADWSQASTMRCPRVLAAAGVHSSLVVPIMAPFGAFGAIEVHTGGRGTLVDADVHFIVAVATGIGAAVGRLRHEEGLRRTSQTLQAILDASPVAIITQGQSGVVQSWNAAAEKIFGYSAEEVVGRQMPVLAEIDGQPAAPLCGNPADCACDSGCHVQALAKDGTRLDIQVSRATLSAAAGGADGVVLTVDDVTQRRRLEDHLRHAHKMEAIGNLTGGIAHDFNNLLMIMVGNLDILRTVVADRPDALELLDKAIHASTRGSDLTRQLLAFAHKQTLQPAVVDVNQLLTGMTKLLGRTLGSNIKVHLKTGKDTWPTLIDPSQLDSAIVNLAINARDAMPEGGDLTIETGNLTADEGAVALQPGLTEGDYVVVSVSDTGTGIPEDVRQRIFEPFFTTKGLHKGTGLGLAMIYGFVKQSGGHVSVYSEVGHGTIFRLYLPRAMDAPDQQEADNAAAEAPKARNGETVLIVEDNDAIREAVERQIGSLGYTMKSASDASQAVAILQGAERVDILFSDVMLPGSMNGLALAHHVSEHWPDIAILLTSGFTEPKLKDQYKEHQFQIIPKPYRLIELARRLETLTVH